ncbi:MAG: DUF4446 family protein [Actinomycetota bacterium]|nr:DUF4446 family protein [Actinomycetota bacterium]
MTLSPQVVTILVLVSLGLAVLSIVLVAMTAASRRTPKGPSLSPDGETGFALKEHREAILQLRAAIGQLAEEDRRLAAALAGTVQKVGLVRYDAFEDMGGRLSFSAALLDGRGTGMVITSINGRSDTRCYAKPVTAGASSHNLSQEEDEAIRQALAPRQPAAAAS